MKYVFLLLGICLGVEAFAQQAEEALQPEDTSLRITNLNPYITQNIDSVFVYQFSINKSAQNYFWYLKNAPVGLSIGKDNGVVSFRAAKNYFLSGKIRYDIPYTVQIGVQSLLNPKEKLDTFFSIVFYNTEIIPSRLKPSVTGMVYADEGDTISFRLQCETGSFPFETILFNSSLPIKNFQPANACGDEFSWTPDYDFVKETDSGRVKVLALSFIGSSKFKTKDTAIVHITVRDALNYPLAKENYQQVNKSVREYVLQLKYTFLQLDKKLKKVKNTRTVFDLTSASTALSGTILTTSAGAGAQKTGQILPSVGLALTPIKETTAPNKSVEQNQATLLRSSIKRLDYMLEDNQLVGGKDANVLQKTQRLKDELKQAQVALLDIPVDIIGNLSEEELNAYFNSPKVIKKYRLKGR
jgi:hypothetical protein